MAATLEKMYREKVSSAIRFLWAKHVSPIEIHRQPTEVCCDGVQYVRKCCRDFESRRMNIHEAGHTIRLKTARTDINTVRAEELIL
jgi:hypothetical protein